MDETLIYFRVQDVSASAMLVYDIANTEHNVSVRVDSLVGVLHFCCAAYILQHPL